MNFPASLGALVLAVLPVGALVGTAQAYTLAEAALPAETPPSSYADDIYVDSRGCVYVRASIGTTVNWVPRLSRDRETVVCNMTPSAGASVGDAQPAVAETAAPLPAEAAPAPTILPVTPTASAAVPASAPVPAPASAPRPVSPPEPERAAQIAVAAPTGAPEVARTVDVTCPSGGAVARVRIGGDTVAVSCPRGLTRATTYVLVHADGSRSRLVAHPAAAPVRGPATAKVYGSVPTSTAAPARVPAGYQPAWDDDRLNPQRGPRTAYGDAQMDTVFDTSKVPMAGVGPAPSVPPGARYVQVGAFRVSANATRAVGTLQGLGFTAATSRTGSGLTLVMAGPFSDPAEMSRALQILRRYYPDAYTRG